MRVWLNGCVVGKGACVGSCALPSSVSSRTNTPHHQTRCPHAHRLLFFALYRRHHKAAIVGLLLICFITPIAWFVVSFTKQVYVLRTWGATDGPLEYEDIMYVKPYFRIVQYVIGILLGVAWATRKDSVRALMGAGDSGKPVTTGVVPPIHCAR